MKEQNEAAWLDQEKSYVSTRQVNGKSASLVVLKSKLAKQYAGFRLIKKDLLIVKKALESLKLTAFDGNSTIVKQSLSFYAVINYAKCFTQSDGRGTRLKEPDALIYADQDQKNMHETIMRLRNKYVAHSELEGFEQNPLVAALNPEEPKGVIEIYDNMMNLVDIDSLIPTFEGLIDAEIRYVTEKCQKVFVLLQADVAKTDIDMLYTQSVNPDLLRKDKIKVNPDVK